MEYKYVSKTIEIIGRFGVLWSRQGKSPNNITDSVLVKTDLMRFGKMRYNISELFHPTGTYLSMATINYGLKMKQHAFHNCRLGYRKY